MHFSLETEFNVLKKQQPGFIEFFSFLDENGFSLTTDKGVQKSRR